MIVTLSTPIRAFARPVTSIALRSPGRQFLKSLPARLDAAGRLPDAAIVDIGARFSGLPASAIRRLSSRDFNALRISVEALIAQETRRQSRLEAIAREQTAVARARALTGEDDE